MFLIDVVQALNQAKIPYALVGGYAVALHGAVRGTLDVDLVLNLTLRDLTNAEKVFNRLGLKSRLPINAEEVFNKHKEMIEKRNVIAWNFLNPNKPADILDVIITEDLNQITIKKISYQDVEINTASIEDLIQMKEKSNRSQDIEDIKALKRLS